MNERFQAWLKFLNANSFEEMQNAGEKNKKVEEAYQKYLELMNLIHNKELLKNKNILENKK